MFRGATAINLDPKGRFAIPAKYRELLDAHCEGALVATINPDNVERCLLIYPLPEWAELQKKLEELPSFKKATRRIQRLLIGHASDLNLDGSGRVLLPVMLREYAGLNKKLMLVGQANRLELWDEDRWYQSREQWIEEGDEDGILPEELQSFSL